MDLVHKIHNRNPIDAGGAFRSVRVARLCTPTIALWLCIIAYWLTFGALSILQHDAFGTSIYDLGNVDQAVWNTLHGRILQFTTQPQMGDIRLSMHIEPILIPISLFYLIYSSPKTLLILQTLALGLGAWPLYLIARLKLRSGWAAASFSVAYLLLPALEAANLFEFHAVVMAPLFLLFCFYFIEKAPANASLPSYIPAFAFAILAMSSKEDIPLLVIMMGLYFLIVARKWKGGLPLIILGSLWFYVAIYMVYPAVRAGKGSPFMHYYENFGDNPFAIAFTLLTKPQLTAQTLLTTDNLHYMLGLLFPFGFLPIVGLPVLLIAAPSLGINLLSSFPLMHELEAKQYAIPIVPFVALAAVYGALTLGRWLRKERAVTYLASIMVLLFALTYHYFRGFSPMSVAYKPPLVTAHHRLADEFIHQIPPDAPLVAQDRLFPHVSQRERAYYVWTSKTDADYIFLDVSHPSFVNVNNVHQWLKDQVDQQDAFGLVKAQDGYLLLKRGAPESELPGEFYSFVKAQSPQSQHPMTVDFGNTLRFLGFDILYDRDREVHFVLYWQILDPPGEDYSIQLHLVNEAGDVIQSTSTPQPALVWYPIRSWRPGETIRVLTNTLPWTTNDLAAYGVALSVFSDQPNEETEVLLMPAVKSAPNVTRLLGHGSVLELAQFRKRWGMPYAVFEPRLLDQPKAEREVRANFDNQVELTAYSVHLHPSELAKRVQVELVWHCLEHVTDSYTVFVHLIDSSGKIWGQQDSLPVRGALPTTSWMPGEYIRDPYTIEVPAEAPVDSLSLAVGLYKPDSGERLVIRDRTGQPVGDHVKIELERL